LPKVGASTANVHGLKDMQGTIWEWVDDFAALMVSGDNRTQGDPELARYCGAGALSANDRENYPVLMRMALLSSLTAVDSEKRSFTMNSRRQSFISLISLMLLLLTIMTFATALPSDSIYRLQAPLIDQNGTKANWADPQNGPRIVSMFYSNCDYVCPMLFEAIKQVETKLPDEQRKRLSVGLVSLDPERDTPIALKKVASQRSVDESRWHLYQASSTDVRKIAAVLGVQYRKLSGGDFNHSTLLILLDAQGRLLARSDQISKLDPAFVEAVKKATSP
jgi:protein SCO1/2